jgi:hypothetical protein
MFGLILPSRPVLIPPLLQTISPTQFAYTFPSTPQFSHIVVFLLPGNELPPEVGAAIYIQFPGSPEFKLLGAIGQEKQSAIFKVNGLDQSNGTGSRIVEVDMDLEIDQTVNGIGDVTVGISIEPAANIATQLASLQSVTTHQGALVTEPASTALPLVKAPPSTKILAQRIIQNAFNFLASFAEGKGGNEVVPLKSIKEWWTKFERRIENDPSFLERDDEG